MYIDSLCSKTSEGNKLREDTYVTYLEWVVFGSCMNNQWRLYIIPIWSSQEEEDNREWEVLKKMEVVVVVVALGMGETDCFVSFFFKGTLLKLL